MTYFPFADPDGGTIMIMGIYRCGATNAQQQLKWRIIMKKLISLLLAFVMLIGCLPAAALAAESAYYVAGTSSLCGSNWSNNDPANQMTKNAAGLYEKTYKDVLIYRKGYRLSNFDNQFIAELINSRSKYFNS